MAQSYTQRTKDALRAAGLTCELVEKYNYFAVRPGGGRGVRHDLFNVIDILALDHSRGIIGIQSTGPDYAGHYRKMTEEKWMSAVNWLLTPGCHLELWAWRKLLKKKGGKQRIWTPRIKVFSLSDFPQYNPLLPFNQGVQNA
jgi:hypothetical protein